MRKEEYRKMLEACLENHALLLYRELSVSCLKGSSILESYIAAQKTPNTQAIKKIILHLIETLTHDVSVLGVILKKLLMLPETECAHGDAEDFYALRFFLQDELSDVVAEIKSKPSGEFEKKLKKLFVAKKILKSNFSGFPDQLKKKFKRFFFQKAALNETLEINQLTDYKNIPFTKSELSVLNDFFKIKSSVLYEIWKESQKLEALRKLSNSMTDRTPEQRPTLEQVIGALHKIQAPEYTAVGAATHHPENPFNFNHRSNFFARTASTTPGQSSESDRSDSVL